MEKRKTKIKKVKIRKPVYGGYGLGHGEDGKIVFVPYVLPNEEVLVKINKKKKDYEIGYPIEIISKSSERILPTCENFGKCGGCFYQHIPYELELNIKNQILKEILAPLIKEKQQILKPIIPSKSEYFYRNQINFQIGKKGDLGFYMHKSYKLIPLPKEGCYLLPKKTKNLLESLYIKENKEKNQYLTLRINKKDEIAYKFSFESKNIAFREFASKFTFYLYIDNFFQVNRFQIDKMVELVLEYLEPRYKDFVLDLYSGVGLFSLVVAPYIAFVLGVEEVKSAVKWAKNNASLNAIYNAKFIAKKVEDFIKQPHHLFNKLIIDPPRVGFHPDVLRYFQNLSNIQKIIFISCNPTTYIRDAIILKNKGFSPKIIQPIDNFPRTYHIEIISLWEKT
jgi:23S rRNA (uracil1939-C5)-methyltransferase